jgi:D-alanyl-D-alanine carboxypeptidase
MQSNLEVKINKILERSIDNKRVFGLSFYAKSEKFEFTTSKGNLKIDDQFFIASTTKLFVTAIIMQLRFEKKLLLEDKLLIHIPEEIISKLNFYNGVDYSNQITIKQLLAHTSGVPDYFEGRQENGKSLLDDLTSGIDQYWSFNDIITETRKIKSTFMPDQKGKALYSDTNFQLLGKIIETIEKKSFDLVLSERILKPLKLSNTFMYRDADDIRPKHMYYKENELIIPRAMSSFGPDGGIISTSKDLMTFLNAFFEGNIIPIEYIEKMQIWNRIFYPLESGIGIHRLKLPWIFSPFKPIPEIIGHSGLSGAFAYFCPKKNLYMTGTVNQISNPDISFKLMIKILNLF